MKKSSHHIKNKVINLYKPILGMCNTISADFIKDGQVANISGVIYDRDNNTFSGSPVYEVVNLFKNKVFTRLYNVEYQGKNVIFATHINGITNITENKSYIIEQNVIPADIIYNQDGLYIASSSNVYHLNNSGEINKLTLSFTPFVYHTLSSRQSVEMLANSVFYYGNKIYFSDNRGLGYETTDTKEIKILNAELKLIDFFVCNSTLFAVDLQDIYVIAGDNISHFLNLSSLNLKVRVGATDNKNLLILNYETSYEIIAIDTLTKKITKYPLTATKGLGRYGQKYVRNINNKLYLIVNEMNEDYTNITSSLYQISFNGYQYVIDTILFENYANNNFLQDIFYIDSKIICYFASPLNHTALKENIELYEYNNNKLLALNYLFIPANVSPTAKVSVHQNRLYLSNTYGIYYVDIFNTTENIPCLLIQNGRLIVPLNSSLYYSGVGDFYNWSWDSIGDALFTEVGYKDGGKIIYAAIVLDSIIVFKDNGNIYRLYGNYPNWIVTKLGEIDKLTTRIIICGSEIIFGSLSGIKKIGVTEYYGDFFLSDYQKNIHDRNVFDISMSLNRNTIVFINDDYIFEYNNILKCFTVYQNNKINGLSQIIELYNNGNYDSYALNKNGILYKANNSVCNSINVKYKEIKNNRNILMQSVTIFTPSLKKDETFTLKFGNHSKLLILKSNKTQHKYFITKRLDKLQIEVEHTGDFFIDNIYIEYATIGQ